MNLHYSIKTIRTLLDSDFIESDPLPEDDFIQNVIIDSRSPFINANSLFVVFKGNKANGADYIADFLQKGGRFVLTDKVVDNPNGSLVQIGVKSPLRALQKLAAHHRNQFDIPVIGITGSNGKTTVKEWLYHVLKAEFSIVRSPKSYNSQIGVALSVLEMDKSHNLAIFEAGISQPGEMEYLEKMIRPNIGLFTGIGDAHNSGFNSVDPEREKRQEKYLLFKNASILIAYQEGGFRIKTEKGEQFFKLTTMANQFGLENGEETVHALIPFQDRASLSNAALTYLAANQFNLAAEAVKRALQTLPTISMRLEKMAGSHGNILINDVYNLDEKSLEMGLQYLNQNRDNRKVVVFLAEDNQAVNEKTTLLGFAERILQQIPVDQFVYFGPKKLGSTYRFVDAFYETTADFAAHPIDFSNCTILFTGSRNSHLETVVNYYTDKKHITRLQVNLPGLRKNLNIFRKKTGTDTRLLAMVKAQSYGGGMVEIAAFLEKEKVDYFGVAYADEGVALRKGGISTPILVMNPEPAAYDDIIDQQLEPSIYSLEMLNAFIHQLILRQHSHFPIHIKLDTGMNRLGFRAEELKELLEMLHAQPEVYIKSVFSHLAAADDPTQQDYTRQQLVAFQTMTAKIQASIGYSFMRHIANSAAAYQHPDSHFDMVRLGIGLFGLMDEQSEDDFENVIQLVSQISQIRKIKPGESVGYGRTYKAEKETTLGVIPVGYADGLRRALSNGKWSIIIQGEKYPIIGNICMDMCMVDLKNGAFAVGDEVQLFGKGNDIFEMSAALGTIPYEIISSISARVQRVYIED